MREIKKPNNFGVHLLERQKHTGRLLKGNQALLRADSELDNIEASWRAFFIEQFKDGSFFEEWFAGGPEYVASRYPSLRQMNYSFLYNPTEELLKKNPRLTDDQRTDLLREVMHKGGQSMITKLLQFITKQDANLTRESLIKLAAPSN